MIYYQQGWKGNTLHEMGGDPFEWLKGAIQPIEPGANLQTFKKSRAMYFISGKMNSKDGRAQRSNKNMIERDLVIMDVDSGEDHQAVAEWLDMLNYAALIYPTPRYEKDKQRFRIVLRADRPITSAESYKATIRAAAREIGIHCDPASETWAQLQGAPISKEGAFKLIELEGNPFPVCEALQFELQPDQAEADRQPPQEGPGDTRTEVKKIPYETALEIIKRYEERDRDNLKDRTNYLSAFMTIIQAVQTGEIDHDTGEACAVLLAGDNKEWQEGNREHFRNEIKKTIPRQEKTFLQKFDWKPGEVDEAHFQFDEPEEVKPFNDGAISGSELLKNQFAPIVYFVDKLITPGMTVLAAPPKYGKSFLALDLALSIATGEEFQDRKTKETKVLYCALEDSLRRIQSRLMTLDPGLRPELLDNLNVVTDVPLLNIPEDGRNRKKRLTANNDFLLYLHKWIEEGVKVIVVDVFQKIRTGIGNRNTYEAEYSEGGRLQEFAHSHGVSIILLHHFKKGSQGLDPVERVGGSTGVTGSADTIITIERASRESKSSLFTVTGRDVPMQEFECEFQEGIWIYRGTVAENKEQARRDLYENNPIVKTLKRALQEEKEYKTTATEFKDKMLELFGYEAAGIKVEKRVFDKLHADLHQHDGIRYQYKRSGEAWHIFTRI